MMRMTRDAALLLVSKKQRESCSEVVRQLYQKWSSAPIDGLGLLLARQRPVRARTHRAVEELEAALAEVVPHLPQRLVWAWSSGGDERYFPTGEIFVLFDAGTSQAKRRKILESVPDVRVRPHRDEILELRRSVPRGRASRSRSLPGFSRARKSRALAALVESPTAPSGRISAEPGTRLRVPVATVVLPPARRDEAFEVAARVAALPGVRAATPNIHALGEKLRAQPQQTPPGPTLPNGVHRLNLVHLAWELVNPSDLAAAPGEFLASRELVAVLDLDFEDHPDIAFEQIGYDTADQDRDPRTPLDPDSTYHGTIMAGIIGGRWNGVSGNYVGIAPGANIVPVRPDWVFTEYVSWDDIVQNWTQFIADFTSGWIDTIARLSVLSHEGVEIANMSFSYTRSVWQAADLSPWMASWLEDGNWGRGVFAAASSGNVAGGTPIAVPAAEASVFAVGVGDLDGTLLGNVGPGVELLMAGGIFPAYRPTDGTINLLFPATSSVAAAVVAGTVALMKGFNPNLTTEEIKSVLRLTTHKAQGQEATEDQSGYSESYGWGFLNAYYAVDVARRDRRPSAELLEVRFRPAAPSRAMIQARQWPWSPYAGKRTGMFWALASSGDDPEQRWVHDRDVDLRGVDQAIDVWGLPFGEQTVVGDFDGDGLDELALQLDAEEFWPAFSADPEQSFLVQKYDAGQDRWRSLGGRSPYASGLASPQVVFPADTPIDGVVSADVTGEGRESLVAWQGPVINVLRYDEASDRFLRLDPVSFAPPLASPAVDAAIGAGPVLEARVLGVAPVGLPAGRDGLLCVGRFARSHTITVHTPYGDFEVPMGPLAYHMTAFLLLYEASTSEWNAVPLSPDPDDTHLVLDGVPLISGIVTGHFSSLSPGSVGAVVLGAESRLHHVSLIHSGTPAGFAGHAVSSQLVSLPGRASRLRAGTFGAAGGFTELAWLSDAGHGNEVRFLRWNDVLREWVDPGLVITHGRKDNEAIDLAVCESFEFTGLAGTHDTIALLMKEPHANVHRSYRWEAAANAFVDMGVL